MLRLDGADEEGIASDAAGSEGGMGGAAVACADSHGEECSIDKRSASVFGAAGACCCCSREAPSGSVVMRGVRACGEERAVL